MNYLKAYERLIERARSRILEGYGENHHILPRCLGGSNNKQNIARLTGREHFVAHVLLVKIYPEEKGLIFAVSSMCRFTKKQERSKNRMYGWLRERQSKITSKNNSASQTAEKNSQYGTCWICTDSESKKIKKEDLKQYLKEGWLRGRLTSKATRKLISNTSKNRFWIKNPKLGTSKRVKKEDLKQYLKEGWVKGRNI